MSYTETHYNEKDEEKWEIKKELEEHHVSFCIGFYLSLKFDILNQKNLIYKKEA
jgi:hypothetical protein